MSTHPSHSTARPEHQPTNTPVTTANAPQTFDPYNTNRTPKMFDDRWEASPE